MNKRALYVLLAIQVLFAGSLIYLGSQAREARRDEYLVLTHRITSGMASEADFNRVAEHMPGDAGAQVVRALFGLPVEIRFEIPVEGEHSIVQTRTGVFWIYYPNLNGTVIDGISIRKLGGAVNCFVVQFDKNDKAKAEWLKIVHIPTESKFEK